MVAADTMSRAAVKGSTYFTVKGRNWLSTCATGQDMGDLGASLARLAEHQTKRGLSGGASDEERACATRIRRELVAQIAALPPSAVVTKGAVGALRRQQADLLNVIPPAPLLPSPAPVGKAPAAGAQQPTVSAPPV